MQEGHIPLVVSPTFGRRTILFLHTAQLLTAACHQRNSIPAVLAGVILVVYSIVQRLIHVQRVFRVLVISVASCNGVCLIYQIDPENHQRHQEQSPNPSSKRKLEWILHKINIHIMDKPILQAHSYSGCLTQNRVFHFSISAALRVVTSLADLPLHNIYRYAGQLFELNSTEY
jgi:hypothetical protein